MSCPVFSVSSAMTHFYLIFQIQTKAKQSMDLYKIILCMTVEWNTDVEKFDSIAVDEVLNIFRQILTWFIFIWLSWFIKLSLYLLFNLQNCFYYFLCMGFQKVKWLCNKRGNVWLIIHEILRKNTPNLHNIC